VPVVVAPCELCPSYHVPTDTGHHIARSTTTGTPLVERIVVDTAVSASLRHPSSDLGVRAMADFDLLVGPERFDEAFAVLTEAEWRRSSPELKYSSRVSPAVTLSSADVHGATVQIDLHRHLAQWPLLKEMAGLVLAWGTHRFAARIPRQDAGGTD
jgi:hypothetical protein